MKLSPPPGPDPSHAIVLLSGGLDSLVCLGLARERGMTITALTIDYNQRHAVELDAARTLARKLGVANHLILPLNLRAFGGSALTSATDVPKDGVEAGAIPVTYVPARNTIFLSLALGLAEATGAGTIFVGVNALDYSGYPDCRPEFIRAFAEMARLGTRTGVEGAPITFETPLLHMTKADIAREVVRLNLPIADSWTCYDPVPAPDGGKPVHCGLCDACRLRAKGFEEAGLHDPTTYAHRP